MAATPRSPGASALRARMRGWARAARSRKRCRCSSTAAASTCCRPRFGLFFAAAAAGDGAGRAQLQQQSGAAAGAAAGRRRQHQPARRAPAADRTAGQRDRCRTGARRQRRCTCACTSRADPGARAAACACDCERCATRVLSLDDGAGRGRRSRCPRSSAAGWTCRACASPPRGRSGLARAWAYVWPDAPLLVYPAPEAHGPPLPQGIGEPAQARLHPAGDDVHHLRAYRRGDPRRAIAWKPSARRDTLLVREYEQPLGADVRARLARSCPASATKRASAGWRAGSTRPNATAAATGCACPDSRRSVPAAGAQHRHACLRALALLPRRSAMADARRSPRCSIRSSRALGAGRCRRLPAAAAAAAAAARWRSASALAAVVDRRAGVAAAAAGLAAPAAGAGAGRRGAGDVAVRASAATPAARCSRRCWRSSPRKPSRLRDARSLLGFALFAPFATFLLDQGPLSLAAGPGRARPWRWPHCSGWPTWNRATVAIRCRRGGASPACGDWSRSACRWRWRRSGCSRAWPRRCGACPNARMARPGLSDRMTPGEWIDLLNDDSTALRVQFFGATPPTSQMYWRGPVLWNFDGRTWTQPRWLRGTAAAAGRARPHALGLRTRTRTHRPPPTGRARPAAGGARRHAACRSTTACTRAGR